MSGLDQGVTTSAAKPNEPNERLLADLLARVDREAHVSQRQLALDLGVALGLVNTYIKRCVRKGLIKVRHVPSRRYAYYLTPKGFAEKTRLTTEYLSWSLSFFRSARAECTLLLQEALRRRMATVGLYGASDLAEIAILSATGQDVKIIAIVDAGAERAEIAGIPVYSAIDAISKQPDGWLLTSLTNPQAAYDVVVVAAGADKLLVPSILSVQSKMRDRL